MEARSARSRRRVETFTSGEALETKGASESARRWVLRLRRMMWSMPLEANCAATCWGMLGRIVRGMGRKYIADAGAGAEEDEGACHGDE
jgi:hypothetical protein